MAQRSDLFSIGSRTAYNYSPSSEWSLVFTVRICFSLVFWAVRRADLLLHRVWGGSPRRFASRSVLERLAPEICFSLWFWAGHRGDLLLAQVWG